MVAEAGVKENCAAIIISRIGATDFDEDVLVPVIIEIGEGNAVALLQMSEPAGGGDVLEEFALSVTEHAIRDQGGEVGIAGSEIKIEPTVIVEIAKIRPHGQEHFVQAGRFSDILECAV